VQNGYNASGNRTSVTYPSGKIVEYDYDLNGRTSQIDVNSNPLVGFTYDPLDRRELKSFATPSALETAYTIDLAEQLQTIQNRINGGGVISQDQYTYDNVGNRLSHMSLAQSFTYGYNDIYELTSRDE